MRLTEYILRILQIKKIPFTSYDLASNEEAKRLWKRKAPVAKQQLPGILVGGVFPGARLSTILVILIIFAFSEEAVEYKELEKFLRVNESWDPDNHDVSTLSVKPVGVPGASSPSQMTNHKPSYSAKPPSLKDKSKQEEELDAGSALEDAVLQGVSVTDAELADLVKELGLEGDEAGDLVKGLSVSTQKEAENAATEEKSPGVKSGTAVEEKKEAAENDEKTEDIKKASKENYVLEEEKKVVG
ncbi:hypothetical protein DFH11DRAFT_1685561 [Phellopilus nigrolimitatus]|nr:hypothetical protein DFH11DRAFT_1685561 [Phellopilus nigrolimitatus]